MKAFLVLLLMFSVPARADDRRARNYAKTVAIADREAYEPDPPVIRSDDYRPIVLCRKRGCTQVSDKMTKSFLFNTLSNMFYINDKTRVHICEADTNSRACKSSSIRYAINVGETAAIVDIPSFTINDVTFSKDLKRVNFSLFYDMYINGIKSFCNGSRNTIEITDQRHALIRDNNYACQLTSDAPSDAYAIYNVDYVDLDYGIIGAYYSMGMSGASNSGADGYLLMKFQNTDATRMRSSELVCESDCDDDDIIKPGEYRVTPLER
ncbi:MAG: hypothetical protein LBL52_04495 [Rickettsiales bacterium]|jgi:hypothetical protein|nr:hypothetical protein [Rickettsiales bacterium]